LEVKEALERVGIASVGSGPFWGMLQFSIGHVRPLYSQSSSEFPAEVLLWCLSD
jgi:hypothetical protein